VSDAFTVLEQVDTLSSSLPTLENVIRNLHEKQEQLGMNQLMFCSGDVNLLGKNINTIKESTETVLQLRSLPANKCRKNRAHVHVSSECMTTY
jgi:hypothetical protein